MVFEIIGLVNDTKYNELREDFGPIVLLDTAQMRRAIPYGQFVIRSSLGAGALIAAVKRTLTKASPEIVFDFRVFKTQIEESLLRERLLAMLSGFFGLLAAVLATVGLYGVMSYTVERRRTEIGIRMALGAGRYAVIGMILREATLLLGIGLSIGTALALLCGFSASSMLFGLEAYDPPTLAMAMAGLAVVTLAASWMPAHRAVRVDPMEALRDE
jgi:ABC-type antimicrobial peptide transport system permease subunit